MGEELRSNGLMTSGGETDDYLSKWTKDSSFWYEDIGKFEFDPEVGAVVVGLDFKVNYSKIAIASLYLEKGCKWVVCNDDKFTVQSGFRAPANGMTVAALE